MVKNSKAGNDEYYQPSVFGDFEPPVEIKPKTPPVKKTVVDTTAYQPPMIAVIEPEEVASVEDSDYQEGTWAVGKTYVRYYCKLLTEPILVNVQGHIHSCGLAVTPGITQEIDADHAEPEFEFNNDCHISLGGYSLPGITGSLDNLKLAVEAFSLLDINWKYIEMEKEDFTKARDAVAAMDAALNNKKLTYSLKQTPNLNKLLSFLASMEFKVWSQIVKK